VRVTVLAARALDWPAEKLRVYLLDDGRRPAFRAFAIEAGVGYIVRPDNRHAKAGNLNHALEHTRGEFVAIFDCDHVPARSFLQVTMGWLVRDPELSLVQTPHHFYSPDPYSRNLRTAPSVPAESELFYGVIQRGLDTWNAREHLITADRIQRCQTVEDDDGKPHVDSAPFDAARLDRCGIVRNDKLVLFSANGKIPHCGALRL